VATTTLGRLPTVVLAPVGRVEDNKALGQESTLEARQTSRVPTQPAKRSRQNASLVETSSACWIRSASPFENPTPLLNVIFGWDFEIRCLFSPGSENVGKVQSLYANVVER
jgi:hypothetical protein